MSYQSGKFLVFALAVLIIYYAIPKKYQKYVLLTANLAFLLVSMKKKYMLFILVTLLSSFFSAKAIGKIYKKEEKLLADCQNREEKQRVRSKCKQNAKYILLVSLLISLGLLVDCKYTKFVYAILNKMILLLNLPYIEVFDLILPLGISFYTFMAVGYVLDVYWKRYEEEQSFVNYAVFLSYFPHVVQGPIDRYNKFSPQIKDGVTLEYKNLVYGAQLLLWGVFKKIVIADRIGIFVDTIYNEWSSYYGVIFLVATVAYAIQLYADFSGCIDIVSGISEMFGIKLQQNFNHPYFSKTIAEFWRRWHISLMEWFRDYVYLPVSTSKLIKNIKKYYRNKGNAKAERLAAAVIPTFVVWMLTGIWHGSSWKFVGWGMYYAIIMIVSEIFSDFNSSLPDKLGLKTDVFSWRFFQMARTFLITCLGRVIFRADSLASAFQIFGRMFSNPGWKYVMGDALYSYGLNQKQFGFAIISVFILWVVDMLQERMCIRDKLAEQNIVFRWLIMFAGILAVMVFGMYGPSYNASSFIYQMF